MNEGGHVALWLDAVIMAVTDDRPRVLTVERALDGRPAEGDSVPLTTVDALPTGALAVCDDRTLELGLRRLVGEQTGLRLGYVEQLYTFGDKLRDPRESLGGARAVSVAYLALVQEARPVVGKAQWRDVYDYFPWEDRRRGPLVAMHAVVQPAVKAWLADAPQGSARVERRERAAIAIGLDMAAWDGERVLERYELLYELALVAERERDDNARSGDARGFNEYGLGRSMALDHRRILASALGRLRGKLRYRPVVFELLPPVFTMSSLQATVESLTGVMLHAGNFRRLVDRGGLVEGTGQQQTATGGRPAELFRFRRDVLRERRAPGVGLPEARRKGDAK